MKKKIFGLIMMIGLITGCGSKSINNLITSKEAKKMYDNGAIIIDVRTIEEYNEKHIKGAINIPLDEIEYNIKSEIPSLDTKIIVYCRSGNRSNMARNTLLKIGYTNVYDLGGIDNWTYDFSN